jgi:hypothetical protein
MEEKTTAPPARALIQREAGVFGLKTGGIALFTAKF